MRHRHSWLCKDCGKKETTVFFRPKWVSINYEHKLWKSYIPNNQDPWDYGEVKLCGYVILAKKRKFEGV